MYIPKKGDYEYHKCAADQYRLKALERKVASLESGEELIKARKRADQWRRRYERKVAGHKRALLKRDKECERSVRAWMQAADDAAEERDRYAAECAARDDKIEQMQQTIAQQAGQIEDMAAYIRTLEHQLGQNSQNSSFPSSQDRPQSAPGKKRGHSNNSRTKSGRKPGAQPGHDHHPRKKLEPNQPPVYFTDRPAGTEGDDDWYMTETYAEKLLVGIKVEIPVTPCFAMIWRNRRTGEMKTSPFPYGMHDETTYSPELKTFVLFCTQYLNIAVRKTRDLLYESTDGRLDVSTGWICQLPREFAAKSREEMAEIFGRLLKSDVLGVDSTVTKVNGAQEAITVACSHDAALLAHTKHKGREAAEALPCGPGSSFSGVIVSDREATFLGLNGQHQQCLAHHLRDLRGISEMEPQMRWAPDMITLMQEMIHTWNTAAGSGISPELIESYEQRYDEILERGLSEYIDNPPNKHYLKGYDLRRLLVDDKDMVLLFLRNPAVPPTNNDSERCLRAHKRHLHQKTTFRSSEYADYHCSFLSLSTTAAKNHTGLYSCILKIFEKPGSGSNEIPHA